MKDWERATTTEEVAEGKRLALDGWVQVSRRYRMLEREVDGTTEKLTVAHHVLQAFRATCEIFGRFPHRAPKPGWLVTQALL